MKTTKMPDRKCTMGIQGANTHAQFSFKQLEAALTLLRAGLLETQRKVAHKFDMPGISENESRIESFDDIIHDLGLNTVRLCLDAIEVIDSIQEVTDPLMEKDIEEVLAGQGEPN